jgi:hypothetical protein
VRYLRLNRLNAREKVATEVVLQLLKADEFVLEQCVKYIDGIREQILAKGLWL